MTTTEYQLERNRIIGQIIRQRKNLGLTQYKLALCSGVERETIQNIESGKRTPRLNTFIRLADALGLCCRLEYKSDKANP